MGQTCAANMVMDNGMHVATPGQKTSYVLNVSVPGLGATKRNPVCFQYFDQKPGKTLKDQYPPLFNIFAKYRTNITVHKDNGNCASRNFNTQIANPIFNGVTVSSASWFRH